MLKGSARGDVFLRKYSGFGFILDLLELLSLLREFLDSVELFDLRDLSLESLESFESLLLLLDLCCFVLGANRFLRWAILVWYSNIENRLSNFSYFTKFIESTLSSANYS